MAQSEQYIFDKTEDARIGYVNVYAVNGITLYGDTYATRETAERCQNPSRRVAYRLRIRWKRPRTLGEPRK